MKTFIIGGRSGTSTLMRVIANFFGISFFQNIDTWKKIKAIPQQVGRWKSR